MKKALFITPYFPPNIGGVQNYVYNIAKGLKNKERWHIVIVTSAQRGESIQVTRQKGMTVYRLPTLFFLSNTPIHPFWYFYIRKIIRLEKPDVINAHTPVPFMADMAALACRDLPFVLTYHAGTMRKKRLIPDIVIGFYEKYILPYTLKKAKRVICSSHFVRTSIPRAFRSKTVVIHPAVDTSLFIPAKRKAGSSKTVLFVGRQVNYETKGLPYLIQAIQTMANVKLKVIGEKIAINDKRIVFVGTKRGKNLVREIQSSDVVVLPSLANMESFGMVLIEAMACKIPVIGTAGSGISEIISNGQEGILVPEKNTVALAKAIGSIIDNPAFAKKLGENGYNKVKNTFTWDKKVKQTKEVFYQSFA